MPLTVVNAESIRLIVSFAPAIVRTLTDAKVVVSLAIVTCWCRTEAQVQLAPSPVMMMLSLAEKVRVPLFACAFACVE